MIYLIDNENIVAWLLLSSRLTPQPRESIYRTRTRQRRSRDGQLQAQPGHL